MTKPASKADDELPDHGLPPGNEHLTFEEFIQKGIWSANEPLIAHDTVMAEMRAMLAGLRQR